MSGIKVLVNSSIIHQSVGPELIQLICILFPSYPKNGRGIRPENISVLILWSGVDLLSILGDFSDLSRSNDETAALDMRFRYLQHKFPVIESRRTKMQLQSLTSAQRGLLQKCTLAFTTLMWHYYYESWGIGDVFCTIPRTKFHCAKAKPYSIFETAFGLFDAAPTAPRSLEQAVGFLISRLSRPYQSPIHVNDLRIELCLRGDRLFVLSRDDLSHIGKDKHNVQFLDDNNVVFVAG